MQEGMVSLVGAGPGDPGLLTLAGRQRLAEADCVIHDKLIDPRVLDFAPPEAERIYIGKESSPKKHCTSQEKIIELLIERARAGKRVVRLKGGDPLLFSRGAEEVLALDRAGIRYEIIPGVTAALGASSTTSIPLTHRNTASAVAFVTGHEDPAKSTTLDWQTLAKFPGTLVVYMALRRIGAIAKELITQGKKADTPIALVEWGGSNRQCVVRSTLGEMTAGPRESLQSPVLAIIGEVCALREDLGWFERRPLFGQRVLLPRPPRRSERICERLESLGAEVLCQPAIQIEPPESSEPIDRAIEELAEIDWLVFSSRNGVEYFLGRLLELGKDLRALGGVRLAAIGPGTAAALDEFRLNPDIVPQEFRSEGLVEAMKDRVEGKRILLARANRGRDLLPEELSRLGARVETVVVYRQIDVSAPRTEVLAALGAGKVDWVLLSSSNMVSAFFEWLDDDLADFVRSRVGLVSISPVTSERIRSAGYQVAVEANVFTFDGMIDALLQKVKERFV